MKYQCKICGYIYDEGKEKQPFSQLAEDWKCPLCGAQKSDFKSMEQSDSVSPKKVEKHQLKQLSLYSLSVVLSNLARGSEKQYKEKDRQDFAKISEYLKEVGKNTDKNTLSDIEKLIDEDLNGKYSLVRETAKENGDRGTQRICVWGEKVTNMLSSLLARYQKEGEQFLKNTNVYVCTICGFIYIGDDAPNLCPICKVPDWKFEKIERRAQ